MRDSWLTLQARSIEPYIERRFDAEPSMRALLIDATRRGRKLRGALALRFLDWTGWETTAEQANRLRDMLSRVEILHAASCIVDDIIDGDMLRRGVPTFHVRNGGAAAALVPILMLTLALEDGDCEQLRPLLTSTRRTILGESFDATLVMKDQSSEKFDSLSMYLLKTTPFFSVAHEFAATCANRSLSDCIAAAEYGAQLGALYQLANDYHDIFTLSADVRGNPDDLVLVTFSHGLTCFFEMYPEEAGLVGKRIPRSSLTSLIDRMRASGCDIRAKALVNETRDRVLSAFPGKPSRELEELLSVVDTPHFWSYKYEQ